MKLESFLLQRGCSMCCSFCQSKQASGHRHVLKVFGEKVHTDGGEKNQHFFRPGRPVHPEAKIQKGGDYGFDFDIGKALRLTGSEPKIRVRDKIPLIAENVRSNCRGS